MSEIIEDINTEEITEGEYMEDIQEVEDNSSDIIDLNNKYESLSNSLNSIGNTLSDLQSSFDSIKNNSSIKDIILENPSEGEVTSDYILSLLSSIERDGLYIFINNTDYSFERFITATPTSNAKKGVEGLLIKEGNYIYIYYLNEVTYKCIITPEHEVEKEDGSIETIPSQYEWGRKILSNIGQYSNNEGHIMILDPVDNQSYRSEYLFSDFLKSDVIKGVLSVYEGSLDSIIPNIMYPLFRDVLVNIFPEQTQGLKELVRLNKLKYSNDLTDKEIEELNILKSSYGEDPYTEENINKIFEGSAIPVLRPDSILEKVGSSYIFNPLNISTNVTPSDKPQLPSGLYIYINYTDKSLISSEYKNEYKDVYGFCSITTPPNNPELCKQYIYYPNLSTYWRGRAGNGYQWLSWNKMLIKNQVYQVVWRESSNLNNLTDPGVHVCDNATRYNTNDNLPVSDMADFSFVLIASANISSSTVGQTLQLTNDVTGKTKLYNRTCKNNIWSQWGESNSTIDLGQVTDVDLKQ